MNKKIKHELYIATEFLSGIFSEAVTEKEYAVIEKELAEFFELNTGNAAAALEEFSRHLKQILDTLMDGGAEKQQKEGTKLMIEPEIVVEGVELSELMKQTEEAGYILHDRQSGIFRKPGESGGFLYGWVSYRKLVQSVTPEGKTFKHIDGYEFVPKSQYIEVGVTKAPENASGYNRTCTKAGSGGTILVGSISSHEVKK